MAKTINGINFSDLSRIGLGSPFNNVINGDISTESDLQDYIDAGEEYRNIQSVLIDWNGADLSAATPLSSWPTSLNTTGQLLGAIKYAATLPRPVSVYGTLGTKQHLECSKRCAA